MIQSGARNAALLAAVSVAALSVGAARAQQAGNSVQPLPPVEVTAPEKPKTTNHKREAGNARRTTSQAHSNAQNNSSANPSATSSAAGAGASAVRPTYHTDTASVGPLGNKSILDTPTSITVIPEELVVNQQVHTVNDLLNFLPSVEIRDQQGIEVSRPQSRGFQGSIVQNTRIDGLNAIGTTAIPAENLAGIQVLNGLAGALYGPETSAGVFNYVLKRPTDTPFASFTEGYASGGTFTEQLDAGGRVGDLGYRVNIVRGDGESYVPESSTQRGLFSGAFDYHLNENTVIEADVSHYNAQAYGLPGSIVYDGASTSATSKSTILPSAPDAAKMGYGQPGAGTDLTSDTAVVKLKHEFNDQWSMEIGGLYENAIRNLDGITNTMTDNSGDYTVTKNFTAVPHFTIVSNEASLNGHVEILGFRNDVTFGTNGFVNGQNNYTSMNTPTLGTSNLANPVVFPENNSITHGPEYKAGELFEQSIIVGDTFHFNKQWAVQAVVNTSFLNSQSWNSGGTLTSSQTANGVVSPTASLIYKPIEPLTFYATYASSVEQSDQAPTSTGTLTVTNSGQFLAPYHDEQYEAGVKYALSKDFLITLDGFRMTRPYATAIVDTANPNIETFQVIGMQRNIGAELFLQGAITPDLSIFGGVTYIDARLEGTGVAATNDNYVVGVPQFKSDVAFDYHPASWNGFAITAAAHYESQRAATNTNNSFAPSFATFAPGVRYTTEVLRHRVTARFQVLNVTNTQYYVSIADGNIVGSPGANTAYLGTPRTFMASLEVDF